MSEQQLSERGVMIQQASWVGIIGNAILALLKITFGAIAGSAAVIADGVDSASDIVGSIITLYANRLSETPPDQNHPWGHRRAEAIATKVLAIIILFAGVQIVISTLRILIAGEARELPGQLAIIVTVISIFGKAGIALYKFQVASKTESSMVRADAINMKNDIFLSLSVLISLAITLLTKLPVVDIIVGLVLGVWIIKSGAELSLETDSELMDSLDNSEEVYSKIFAVVDETPGVYNPHKARVRKLNDLYDITLDIEVEGSLTVFESHEIVKNLEENIKEAFPKTFDIVIHVEPIGNKEDEQYGLSQESFE